MGWNSSHGCDSEVIAEILLPKLIGYEKAAFWNSRIIPWKEDHYHIETELHFRQFIQLGFADIDQSTPSAN